MTFRSSARRALVALTVGLAVHPFVSGCRAGGRDKPLPPEHCPMPDAMRPAFESLDEATANALDAILIEHRDFVYDEHLELPLSL